MATLTWAKVHSAMADNKTLKAPWCRRERSTRSAERQALRAAGTAGQLFWRGRYPGHASPAPAALATSGRAAGACKYGSPSTQPPFARCPAEVRTCGSSLSGGCSHRAASRSAMMPRPLGRERSPSAPPGRGPPVRLADGGGLLGSRIRIGRMSAHHSCGWGGYQSWRQGQADGHLRVGR
jgi:hypothetical protein